MSTAHADGDWTNELKELDAGDATPDIVMMNAEEDVKEATDAVPGVPSASAKIAAAAASAAPAASVQPTERKKALGADW